MMFKPRGPQRPKMRMGGISPRSLITFFKDAEVYLTKRGKHDEAFNMMLLIQYFENNYDEDKPLKFDPMRMGM